MTLAIVAALLADLVSAPIERRMHRNPLRTENKKSLGNVRGYAPGEADR